MDPNRVDQKNNDEINLGQFLDGIRHAANSLANSFLFGLASLRNLFFDNRLFFVGIIVVGLILGGIYSELLKKDFYKSTMVLNCDYLNTQILESTIDKFNLLCAEPKREGLAEVLAIDNSLAQNIQRFEFVPFVSEDDVVEMEVLRTQLNTVVAEKKDIVEKVIDKLQIENKNAYAISVQVYEPDIVKPLEKALVKYFNTNDYIKKRVESNRKVLLMRKEKLISDSRKLDSLKFVLFENYKNIGKTSRGSNNVILSDQPFTNPIDIYTQDLLINQELMSVESQLYIRPDFEVIDGFTTFKEPESASLFKILVIAFFVSILVGYLVIGAWKFDAMLAKINTKSK